jgi:hypothetical protein
VGTCAITDLVGFARISTLGHFRRVRRVLKISFGFQSGEIRRTQTPSHSKTRLVANLSTAPVLPSTSRSCGMVEGRHLFVVHYAQCEEKIAARVRASFCLRG